MMEIQQSVAGVRTAPGRRRFASRIFGAQEAGLLGIVLLLGLSLAAFGGNLEYRDRTTGEVNAMNRFANWENIDKLLKNTSFFAIMAIGVSFVIVTGGIDLSIGSTYCLAAVAGALFLGSQWPFEWTAGAPPILIVPAGILLCLAVGLLGGLLNGSMVVLLGVHSFIITLGTMGVFRGVAFVMTEAQAITGFPEQFTDGLIRCEILGLNPVPMAIMVAVAAVATVYLTSTVAGRHVYAVGGNEEAARFSGLPVDRVKLKVYAFAGLSAGIAAMITLGYYGSADSSTGKGYELDVIAAAVVGGASLSGGRGTALGALLGALIIQMISNGIIILQIDQNYSQIIIGTVIVLAVVLDRINAALRQRRLAGAARGRRSGAEEAKGVEG
jgi:ribose/xylose/arabinose/galactoside ABC-type transport system permease subunit